MRICQLPPNCQIAIGTFPKPAATTPSLEEGWVAVMGRQ